MKQKGRWRHFSLIIFVQKKIDFWKKYGMTGSIVQFAKI